MSEIPFVNRLGDALEEAFAAEPAAKRGGPARWRRPRLLVVFAVLAVGGAATAGTLLNSSKLALHPIECAAGHNFDTNIDFPENTGAPPVQICARALGVPAATLIACAGGRYTYVSVFYRSGRDQCRRLGLQPLPAAYAGAQARVQRLERALLALQSSAYCLPPGVYAARAQQILNRLGWSGWTVFATATIRDEVGVPGGGDCAAIQDGADGRPDVVGALDPDHHVLSFELGPPPTFTRLVGSLAVPIEHSTAVRCWTDPALRASVRHRLAAHGLPALFTAVAEPPGEAYDDGRQARYARGCAIVALVLPAAENRRLVDVVILQKGAAAPPDHGFGSQSAFR